MIFFNFELVSGFLGLCQAKLNEISRTNPEKVRLLVCEIVIKQIYKLNIHISGLQNLDFFLVFKSQFF